MRLLRAGWVSSEVLDQLRVHQLENQHSDSVEVVGESYALSSVVNSVLLPCRRFRVEDEHLRRHGMQGSTRYSG